MSNQAIEAVISAEHVRIAVGVDFDAQLVVVGLRGERLGVGVGEVAARKLGLDLPLDDRAALRRLLQRD